MLTFNFLVSFMYVAAIATCLIVVADYMAAQ
jgi:hypothetical protein